VSAAGPGDPPVGYLVTDPKGEIRHANDLVLSWLQADRSAVVGARRFPDLLAGGGRIFYETHLSPLLLMSGSTGALAVDLATPGGPMPIFITAVLDRDGNGQPDQIRIALVDAADRRSYELELLAERQRAEESERHARRVARTLQQVLVPSVLPTIEGLDVGAAFRPAGSGIELGGDFYDLFELNDGSWYLVVGDVCGKGVEAAVVTALARSTIRAEAVRSSSLTDVLTVLHQALLVHESSRHCTVAVVRLVQRELGWRAPVCCAGHPLPVWRGADGSVGTAGRAGSLLGLLPEVRLREETVDLSPGQALVLYTDGVVEGRTAEGFFGEQQLLDLVAAGSPDAQGLADAVMAQVVDFQSGITTDDAAILVARVP
jgi:sigma-B regulation protein RsbU (phosphoserine phosphatase)